VKVAVVGIGADGWAGLGKAAREALGRAAAIVGSSRQLELLPQPFQERAVPWPSPIAPLLERICAGELEGVCVLASGNPMLFGIGATLARRLGPQALEVHPHPSALAYVCARLGWPQQEVALVDGLSQPLERVVGALAPGAPIVVYLSGPHGASRLAGLLCDHGLAGVEVVICSELGGPRERLERFAARELVGREIDHPLHCAALRCPERGNYLPRCAGLEDRLFANDGQLTKWPLRALAVARLAPLRGRVLWDVGAGNGSVGLEWLRLAGEGRLCAVERDPARAERIEANAGRLGLAAVEVVVGEAPAALARLPSPDAVFIGGGLTAEGLVARCWEALPEGGAIVAHATTLEGEAVLADVSAKLGGELLRVELADARPLGRFRSYVARHPVVQWSARKG